MSISKKICLLALLANLGIISQTHATDSENLLIDSSLEPGTVLHQYTTNASDPWLFGEWNAENANIINGPIAGITPRTGNGMLRVNVTGGGVSQVSQMVDLSGMLTPGDSIIASYYVNANTATDVRLRLVTGDGQLPNGSPSNLTNHSTLFTTDADPNTWELVTFEITVPTGDNVVQFELLSPNNQIPVNGVFFDDASINIVPDIHLRLNASPEGTGGCDVFDQTLETFMSNICNAGTMTTYSFSDHFGVSCMLSPANVPGLSQDQSILITKFCTDKHTLTVQNVADAKLSTHFNIFSGCNQDPNNANHFLCSDLEEAIPDAGISGVEPKLYTGPNVITDGVPVTSLQTGKLDIGTISANIYGVAVTNALYRALQEVQFGPGAIGSNLEEHMPSLSKTQITSLFAGGLTNWDDLKVNDAGSVIGLASFPFTSPAAAPTLDTFGPFSKPLVHICRYTPGSSTQAQFNAKFSYSPCIPGAPQPITSSNPIVGPIVQQNQDVDNLTICLNDKQTDNKWAVGIQSLHTSSPSWKFIKVDHIAPSLQNVAYNNYFDWVETTMQWRNSTSTINPTLDELAVLQIIRNDLYNPANVANINAGLVPGFFDSMPSDIDPGFLLTVNTNGYTPTLGEFSLANPVTTATHVFTGNTCSCFPPIINVVSSLSWWVGGHIGW